MSGFLQQQTERTDDQCVVFDEQNVWNHSGRAAHRDREEEAASLAECALDPETAVVQLDELARDREAEPRAVMLPRRGCIDLRELAEDELVMLGRDADARVADLDEQRVPALGWRAARAANPHASRRRG